MSVDLSFGRYDCHGTTHVIFGLYLDDATFIFQAPLRVHVITSLSGSTLREADVLYSVVRNFPGRTVRWTVALFLFRLVVVHWSVGSSA